ncbi:GNAT family N-acetyltransferase [Haloimpatiens massiliensis]|uniref:GNAT family N-acetyltransferase n=1 Tax=Haloimpatiens massiliensis TaxID=1658110 RepID=UPI000C849D47|nr:GNAT family N-acetyltransferase [Haloimpatiens massiliensis]
MFTCKRLRNTNISIFRELNSERNTFNDLNEDFFYLYDKITSMDRFIMMKKVILLQHEESLNYIGYIWLYKLNRYNYKIRAFNVGDKYKYNLEAYSKLVNYAFKDTFSVNYVCNKNDYNFNILYSLGFKKNNGTLKMKKNLNCYMCINKPSSVEICNVYDEKGDSLRCKIQNSIFESNNRIPLTLDDIFFEKKQKYYYNDGCFLLKLKNEYIGYGQVIFEEEDIPCIVNFGIISKYRGLGYSKYFLSFILNRIYKANYKLVNIKVSSENKVAINLYTSMGFYIEEETCKWQLIK